MLDDMQLWQIQRKVHPSWLIAVLSVGIVIGAASVPVLERKLFSEIVWLIAALGLSCVALWRRSAYVLPLVVIAGLIIGLWRGSVLQSELTAFEDIVGHRVKVTGTISDDPDEGRGGETLLRLGHVMIKGNALPGKVWVSMHGAKDIKRGDIVSVEGLVSDGFGSFSAVMYRAEVVKIQRPEPGDVARQARDWFADKIRLGIQEPQSSLGLGYLLGQRRALPEDITQALVVTGLTHIVVASGYNLTILVRLARRLFVKVSKYLATLASTMMILGFMAVTGASPSMTRAGLVAGLSLAAWYYGRRFHPLVLLPFAAAITVMIDPTFAWNDLGWQLSFAAFAGVMIVAPMLQIYFFGNQKPGIVRQIMGETISASIITLPILVLAFGQFSNVALLTNMLVLPLVPLAMLLTFVTGIGAAVVPGLATYIGAPADWLLTYMIGVVRYFAGLPWAQTTLTIQPWVAMAAYTVIIIGCIYLWKVTKYDLRDSNLIE